MIRERVEAPPRPVTEDEVRFALTTADLVARLLVAEGMPDLTDVLRDERYAEMLGDLRDVLSVAARAQRDFVRYGELPGTRGGRPIGAGR